MMNNKYIFPIYKPIGISSFDVIRQLRKITGIRKIGHAGTLEPLAEGVLVVGITRNGTKQLHQLLKCDKEYLAEIKLGADTSTGDREGEEITVVVGQEPTLAQVDEALKSFEGEIEQTPHRYSAVKIKGQPAYKLARKGKEFQLQPKKVFIHQLEITKYQYPLVKIRAKVGSGVYIRSLARDLGKKLKTGAYLISLIRTRVGNFSADDSLSLQDFAQKWEDGEITISGN